MKPVKPPGLSHLAILFWRRRKGTIELGTIGRLGLARYRVHTSKRATHMYVVGITGKDESKLLEHVLFQDIVAGQSCGVGNLH
ncbi:MAG: hypothetical protein KC418_06180 [Anaerolineales bacterium]|nr:hypothetical protein [Anaerolineales bacterium]